MPPGRGGAIQTSHIGTQSSPREAPAAPARAASAMTDFLLANEPALRLAFFFGALAALMVAEAALPRRRREIPRLTRWSGPQIGRAHVCTPVTNAHLVCRLLLEKNKHILLPT